MLLNQNHSFKFHVIDQVTIDPRGGPNALILEHLELLCQVRLNSYNYPGLDSVNKAHDTGKLVSAVFLDLSKAFDMVSHPKLLKELSSIGLSSSSLQWFSSYLADRQQEVK